MERKLELLFNGLSEECGQPIEFLWAEAKSWTICEIVGKVKRRKVKRITAIEKKESRKIAAKILKASKYRFLALCE